ncbi:MAG: hypothetical protein GXP25_06360 [Planctomycetes bacterium]|nr:hypothetical protein [Planctomycetota bacterium]
MNRWIALLLCAAVVLGTSIRAMADGPNMLKNADFAELDGNGKPAHWTVSFQGKGVKGLASVTEGPDGKRALKIECTEFPRGNGHAWVIFKQRGTVKTKKRQRLYVSFWLKQERLKGGVVNLNLMRVKPWGTLCKVSLPVTREWSKAELLLTPHEACDDALFEIFFTETGTLYLSDIHIAETTKDPLEVNPIRLKMVRERQLPQEKNVLWNGSFEAGIDGWGTEGFDYNVVKIDRAEAQHGTCSARIDFDKNSVPIGYPDYSKARKVVFTKVLCASKGWTRFEKGRPYTLSAYLKSNRENFQASIGVYFMTGARKLKRVTVTDEWQPAALTFTARDLFGFVGIEAETKDFSEQLWIDAVQLEKGDRATQFDARYPVEVAFRPRQAGGIYYTGDETLFDVECGFRSKADRATVDLKVLDYQDREVHQRKLDLAEGSVGKSIRLPVKGNGHYRLIATVRGKGFEYTRKTCFVIIYPYARTYGNKEARFGTNHPYYSDRLQKLAGDAGVYWVRDWTLKWDNVEPEKGKWDFSAPEIFFARARRLNLHVLAILPDPSAGWASSGPPEARGKRLGDAFEDLWYLPRDMQDYRRYVRKCIERYKDVSRVWEVLNEPFKTRGWDVGDQYGQFLRIVKEEARRADKALKVMRCGLCYYKKDEEANTEAARLADILSEHMYPRYNDTKKFVGKISMINDFLQRHGVKTDIWVTEYGKYSNDDPSYKHARFSHYYTNGDERTAAAYNIKYLTVLFSHGVSKVFFHQRTWPIGLNYKGNGIHFDMLFDYGPRPHKFFPAANAMAWFLRPGSKPGRPINEQGPIFAYTFDRPQNKVMVLWADKAAIKLDPGLQGLVRGLAVYNLMGRKLEGIDHVGDEPVYLTGSADRIEALEKALAQNPG